LVLCHGGQRQQKQQQEQQQLRGIGDSYNGGVWLQVVAFSKLVPIA
jgi:hypothetical protein